MSRHATLDAWASEAAALCRPDHIHWSDGSAAEHDDMLRILVQAGTAIPLSPELRPDSFLVRSHPADVARVEARTFICSATREGAGPTNNWADPAEMKGDLACPLRRLDGGADALRHPPVSAGPGPPLPSSSPRRC